MKRILQKNGWISALVLSLLCPLSAQAGVICSSSFTVSKTSRHRSKQAAKKQARKRVSSAAQRRCRKRQIVFMKRWSYRCKKRSRRGKRIHCRAVNRVRCCQSTRRRPKAKRPTRSPRNHKPSPIRLAANHTARNKALRPTSKHRWKPKQAIKRYKIIALKPRRTVRKREKATIRSKRWCSHQMEAKGYSRQKQPSLARKEARKQARANANKKCKPSKTIWMGVWSYRCTKSRHIQLCRASIPFKCCQ